MSKDYRYEIKFVLNEVQLSEFEFWMLSRTSMRETYQVRVVNSLYFDDVEYRAARDNLIGLANREKYRLRWYGDANHNEVIDLKLEKKAREGRLGYKQSRSLQPLQDRLLKADLEEIANECREEFFGLGLIDGDMSAQLMPALYVKYSRQYFKDVDDIRITIDRGIGFSNVQANAPLLQCSAIPFSKNIVEIKFSPELKGNAAQMIESLHIVPKRCSKYLQGLSMIGVAVYI